MTATGVTTNAPGNVLGETGDTEHVVVRYIYRLTDPFTITLRFLMKNQPPTEWDVSRELLAEALADYEPHGVGDVTFTRVALTPTVLMIHVENGHGDATVATTDAAAQEVIRQSLLLVPAGSEQVDVDGLIAACMSEADHG